jgi:hypothetical protein
MSWWVLDLQAFYTKLTGYMTHVGLPWDARDEAVWQAQMPESLGGLIEFGNQVIPILT